MKRGPFALALATTGATFLLLLAGGTVNPTGSSLACPDWPTCHGSFFPAMRDGVQFEHTHRLVATAVGLMTVALAVTLWRVKGFRMLGVAALGMVVLQGVLGGLTVLLKLPMAVSAGHLALSMLVFCYFIYLSFRLWPGRSPDDSSAPTPETPTAPRAAAGIAAIVVYAQILLGALVRHTHAGRACNDSIPWCRGSLWPEWGPAQIHMLHRYAAVVTVLVVIGAGIVAYRTARRHQRAFAARLALAAPLLVAVQFLLGILTVTSSIGVVEVTAHLGIGALLLADFAATWFALGPQMLRRDDVHPAVHPQPVAAHEAMS